MAEQEIFWGQVAQVKNGNNIQLGLDQEEKWKRSKP